VNLLVYTFTVYRYEARAAIDVLLMEEDKCSAAVRLVYSPEDMPVCTWPCGFVLRIFSSS